ncbi:MAG: hypothetical protein AB7G75_10870 [Candidatus Binatia bacterium]
MNPFLVNLLFAVFCGVIVGVQPLAADTLRDPVIVKNASGQEILKIRTDHSDVRLDCTTEGTLLRLMGKLKDSGKRKYQNAAGETLYEVKYKGDGFKLRTADGRLLWKVKLKAEKIKISNNEENLNPFEIWAEDGQTLKAGASGRELGTVSLIKAPQSVQIYGPTKQERYRVETPQRTKAYGLLLLEEIPEVERYILMAEFVASGY